MYTQFPRYHDGRQSFTENVEAKTEKPTTITICRRCGVPVILLTYLLAYLFAYEKYEDETIVRAIHTKRATQSET